MKRKLYREEHDALRTSFRTFLEREVIPHQDRFRKAGIVDRDIWVKAGSAGFLCPWLAPEWGGPGGDFLHSCVILEELSRAYESGLAISLHSDVVVPYIDSFGSAEQKRAWLPKCASGEWIGAIGMTEPGTGSDVAAIATTARREGDTYVINGTKTFISNGILCDFVVLAAKTGEGSEAAHKGLSLFLVEATRPGFHKSKKLEKIGMWSQDTAELSFEECRIPAHNLLGEEGAGFFMLMQKLQQERLVVAVGAQAAGEKVLEDTIAYCRDRKAFGKPISKFQNTQFELVECATELEMGRAFLDRVIEEHVAGEYLVKECSMAKYWITDMTGRVVDRCLQLFGGYGYMVEYPIARAYVDARVQRIFAGTNEIMKIIVAKQMGL